MRLLLWIVLLATGTAVAAAPPVFTTLAVDVWPEHDDPRLLVIYRGTLSAAVALPQTLTFAIPPDGQVNAAAYRGEDGQLFTSAHQYRQEPNRLLVSFAIPTRGFQFEYYVGGISPPPQRAFALDLIFPLPVEDLRVAVEQPLRSSAFALTPSAAETTVTPSGFTNHLYSVGRWPAGRAWRVKASYRKEDASPSIARTAGMPAPGPAIPRAAAPPAWLWPVVGGLAAVLAGLGVWFLRRGGPAGRADVYCVHCGARPRPRDRYCGRCGRRLAGG